MHKCVALYYVVKPARVAGVAITVFLARQTLGRKQNTPFLRLFGPARRHSKSRNGTPCRGVRLCTINGPAAVVAVCNQNVPHFVFRHRKQRRYFFKKKVCVSTLKPPADPILSAFKEAAEFLNNTRGLKMDTETKLAFYGLFKVATHGPCTAPAPSRLDVVAAAKWYCLFYYFLCAPLAEIPIFCRDAWRAASMFSQHEAMRKYIELASEKVPQWRQRRTPAEVLARDTVKAAAVPGHDLDEYDDDVGDDDDIDDEAADEIPDHEKTFGVSVSRLAETKDVEVEQEDRDLFYYIQEGNLAHVDRLLPSFGDLTQADPDQGMTPLHWASDRNLVDIASSLIKAGAPVDVKVYSERERERRLFVLFTNALLRTPRT